VKFLFSDHTLDTDRRELRRGDALISIEPQVFDLLLYLVQNGGRVVSKSDLFASVWRGRMVSDLTIASRLNAARKAIGDTGSEQRLIRTFPRRGVRFVGEVQTEPAKDQSPDAAALPPAEPQRHSSLALPPTDRPAIAVLPFVNLSGEQEQEYFSDGISEDIITALSKLRWFFIIARNSSFMYKGKSVPMKQVAEELGVGYIVEGSVRKMGDRVRISAQLNDVATGSQIWAERYDRQLADVFAVQDEITEAVVAAIEPQIYAAENFRAERKPPESLDAWDLVMRALSHFWRLTSRDNVAAQSLLDKAIAIDPNYGRALGVLAVSHTFDAQLGWKDRKVSVPIAHRMAQAALRADDEDPWAHLALATNYVNIERYEDSLAEFEAALRLNPNFPLALGTYGLVLCWCDRWKEGNEAARRALLMSPRDPFSAIYNGVAAYAEFLDRNYDESIRLARDGIRQRADFVASHRMLAAAAGMGGRIDLAKTALQDLRRIHPGVSLAWMASQVQARLPWQREHILEGLRRAGLE
jgi:TolB-like protein